VPPSRSVAIDNAEREILVGAYGLTTGSGIVEGVGTRQATRGVDVRLIADKTTAVPGDKRLSSPWPLQACRSGSTVQARIAPRQNDGDRRGG